MNDNIDRLKRLREIARRQEKISQYTFQADVRECANILNSIDPAKRKPWLVEVILEMYADQNGLCALCGKHMDDGEYEVDHIVPHKYGGGNESTNIQLAHISCNREKGSSVDPSLLLRYLEDRYQNLKF